MFRELQLRRTSAEINNNADTNKYKSPDSSAIEGNEITRIVMLLDADKDVIVTVVVAASPLDNCEIMLMLILVPVTLQQTCGVIFICGCLRWFLLLPLFPHATIQLLKTMLHHEAILLMLLMLMLLLLLQLLLLLLLLLLLWLLFLPPLQLLLVLLLLLLFLKRLLLRFVIVLNIMMLLLLTCFF